MATFESWGLAESDLTHTHTYCTYFYYTYGTCTCQIIIHSHTLTVNNYRDKSVKLLRHICTLFVCVHISSLLCLWSLWHGPASQQGERTICLLSSNEKKKRLTEFSLSHQTNRNNKNKLFFLSFGCFYRHFFISEGYILFHPLLLTAGCFFFLLQCRNSSAFPLPVKLEGGCVFTPACWCVD